MVDTIEANGLRFDMFTFTGEEQFLAPNAVLVSGRHDAILVDTGFVAPDVARLLAVVRASGKRLRAILITHAHPDHYGGVSEFAAALAGHVRRPAAL